MTFFIDTDDKRNVFVKELMTKQKFNVQKFCGFNEIGKGDVAIFAPNKKFDNFEIDDVPKNFTLICGNIPDNQEKLLAKKNVKHINLLNDEVFAIKNSTLTAEGILANVLQYTTKSLLDLKILILGNGRVGKATAQLFNKLGLDFSISSHDKNNFALSFLFGKNNFFQNDVFENLPVFDVIINTIPERIFSETDMLKIKKNCLFLEIASQETIPQDLAKHFSYIKCPALPQKFSCETAGKVMFEAILQMLK